MDNSQARLFPGQKAPGKARGGQSLRVSTFLTMASRGNFFEHSSGRQQQPCTTSNKVVTTFSFSLPQLRAACAGHRGYQFPKKSNVLLTPAQPSQPAPEANLREEQWVAKTKVTCPKWRPAPGPWSRVPGPASHLAQTLGTSLPLPCPPPRAAKASPKS